MKLVEFEGFVWPRTRQWDEGRAGYRKKYIDRAPDMEHALKYARGRDVAVQAGGNVGVWPRWLSSRFGSVYTFEPDEWNFVCLARNTARPNVFAARGCLGYDRGPICLARSTKSIGAHQGVNDKGTVPVFRIDDLSLRACDVLVLDVEGMELPALRGAAETIRQFRPVIMIEDRGHGGKTGWGSFAETEEWLAGLACYRQKERIAHDVIFTSE